MYMYRTEAGATAALMGVADYSVPNRSPAKPDVDVTVRQHAHMHTCNMHIRSIISDKGKVAQARKKLSYFLNKLDSKKKKTAITNDRR